MKPIVKPHSLKAIEREKGAQPQWVPNVSLYDVGKENATNILWESATLGTTKSGTSWFLLATLTKHEILCSLHYHQKLWYSLAPLLPCFPLHVLSIYLTSLPHLSSSLGTLTNPLKTSLPISLWVSILANSWSTPLTSLSLKIEFVRSLRTPFLPRIPPANDHCTHFLIFYFNPAQWLRHVPERYTRHVQSCTVVKAYTREIYQTRSSRDVVWHTSVWNHGAWPHIIFRIWQKSQSGDHP